MIYPFNAVEAFKIAVGIEENGRRFYAEAAKKTEGPVRELLESLAKEEEIHKATFAKFLAELPPEQPSVFDPDNETDQYLKMMADINIFEVGSKEVDRALAGDVLNVKDALRLAMGFEKDSIVFYVQLKNSADKLSDKVGVDHLILEEAKHLRKLARIYNALA